MLQDTTNHVVRRLTCSSCGRNRFQFTWRYPKDQELGMILAHEGIGFRLEDAEMNCSSCGAVWSAEAIEVKQ